MNSCCPVTPKVPGIVTSPLESTVKLLLTLKSPIEERVPWIIVLPLAAATENFSVQYYF